MLKDTETVETIIFIVTFLSLVAFQLEEGGPLAPPGYAYVACSIFCHNNALPKICLNALFWRRNASDVALRYLLRTNTSYEHLPKKIERVVLTYVGWDGSEMAVCARSFLFVSAFLWARMAFTSSLARFVMSAQIDGIRKPFQRTELCSLFSPFLLADQVKNAFKSWHIWAKFSKWLGSEKDPLLIAPLQRMFWSWAITLQKHYSNKN